ncbi:MAG: hypothetical protein IH587_00435, partial [Anaerolineae bacterium]|nr:hypothetical protein [Anaerolineae bacterium]
SRDILENHFVLPTYATYNNVQIPFAYPPLALYLAAFMTNATGIPLIEVYRWLPAIMSTLTIIPFFLLAKRILRTSLQALIATLVFALVPRSMLWMIMGGGITRSLGFFFALFTLWQVHVLYVERKGGTIIAVVLLASLTILSHTEMAWFTLLSVFVMWVFYGRSFEATSASFIVAGGVIFATALWWISVVGAHGIQPFVSAFGASGDLNPLLWILSRRNFSDEPMLAQLAILGLLGIFVSIALNRWFLPVWVVALFTLNTRSAGTTTMVPLMMGLALTVDLIILRTFTRMSASRWPTFRIPWNNQRLRLHWIPSILVCAVMVAYALASISNLPRYFGSELYSLDETNQVFMQWISNNTPPTGRFAVVTSSAGWEVDAISEWFPTITQRISVGTVQGTEWLPADAFRQSVTDYFDLQLCAALDVRCLETWATNRGRPYNYVYVASTVTGALVTSLETDPDYRFLLEVSGVKLYEFTRATELFGLPPAAA